MNPLIIHCFPTGPLVHFSYIVEIKYSSFGMYICSKTVFPVLIFNIDLWPVRIFTIFKHTIFINASDTLCWLFLHKLDARQKIVLITWCERQITLETIGIRVYSWVKRGCQGVELKRWNLNDLLDTNISLNSHWSNYLLFWMAYCFL